MQHFYIIGISDRRTVYFAPDVERVIRGGKVFSGGKRHHEIVRHLLPAEAVWIDITVPLDAVFAQYAPHAEVVVFASGDPLFFGFANTVQRLLPDAAITLFPSFNSLQLLAHRCLIPYQDMRIVSLTGRPWHLFDKALIEGEALMGVLTDRDKTPALIAQRMIDYGYTNYRMVVGELLGNEEKERITHLTLDEASRTTFGNPNNLILQRTAQRKRHLGIPDSEFHLLNGRARMITKHTIRLLTLGMLDLHPRTSLWDVGFCTGSISIEAKLLFPHLHITAFEQRPEGEELMALNSRKHGAPGITALIGDFMQCDLAPLQRPDAVFIGGHGGKLIEMVERIDQVLLPGGVIVFNAVTDDTRHLFEQAISRIGRTIVDRTHVKIDDYNAIEIMKAL